MTFLTGYFHVLAGGFGETYLYMRIYRKQFEMKKSFLQKVKEFYLELADLKCEMFEIQQKIRKV